MEGIQLPEEYPEGQRQLYGDELAIEAGIAAAREAEAEVSNAVARAIASQLHGGQGSALYSLASTGNLADDRLRDELSELYSHTDPKVRDWAGVLATYALHRPQKGSVDGWHQLWPVAGHDAASVQNAEEVPVDLDEAGARQALFERITRAGVTTLGEIATISTIDPADDLDDYDRDLDPFPWTSAAYWHANGDGADELGGLLRIGGEHQPSAELFSLQPVDELGSRVAMGWCGLIRHVDRPGGAVLRVTPYGRRAALLVDTDAELEHQWRVARERYEAFVEATHRLTDGDAGPQIWVGSLADYNAGYLHGAWLDAAMDATALADAVQFILANSHEADAEEYAVMDYEGFGEDLTRELGEYPTLETVTRLAQGIEEHGPAFAEWAAYVGPNNTEQLDRFEDHYLGEWDSLTAYAEHLLEEMDAYRVIEEAPEWLQPYLSIDVEDYAQDLQMELHVVDASGGGVWVFDTRA